MGCGRDFRNNARFRLIDAFSKGGLSIYIIGGTVDTNRRPRMAKAHSRLVAEEYLRLGWTLKKEFYAEGHEEPCEYFFTWDRVEEPPLIDWGNFRAKGKA